MASKVQSSMTMLSKSPHRFKPALVLPILLTPSVLFAQLAMQGSGPGGLVRIFNTDAAVLEGQEHRRDLPCAVTPIKPQLGFDMKFHAGYDVSVPLREL